MDVPPIIMYSDPALIDTIVGELKSQGTFDQFRKECIADVDTKPAYQNLHQRVETTVSNFLEGRAWRSDLNKNQLRDSLRKHILEMGFLDTGVERIVDQVVNPKVHAVFMPQVEDVVYRVQGIPKPEKTAVPNSSSAATSASKTGGAFNTSIFNQPPPFLPGLSFLPLALQSHIQKAPTLSDLLPTDLDPVSSPESSKDSDMKNEFDNVAEESGIIHHHDDSMDSQLSGISDLTSHGSDHAASIKSERRGSVPFDDTNEDLSNASSKHKVLDEIEEAAFSRAEECETEVHHEAHSTLKTNFDDGHQKSSYASDPVMHYEDQYSVEEEVATTLSTAHCEIADEVSIKEEADICIDEKKKSPVVIENIGNNVLVDDLPETKPDPTGPVLEKYECTGDNAMNLMDDNDNSLVQSEDSQLSGSSDNKLHIDEMKDFNSQSGNSHQNDDDQSGMKTMSEEFLSEDSCKPKTMIENVVEASEEARHGFDDSQDALERPPMPSTPPAPHNLNQPPPVPPFDSSSDLDEKHLPSSSPSSALPSVSEKLDQSEDDVHNTMKRLSQTPPLPIIEKSFTPLKRPDGEHLPCAPTLPTTGSPSFEKCPPLPPTPVAVNYPPLPPATPPPVECPPLPPTPPLPESLNVVPGRPPLPPTPPLPDEQLSPGRPQLPPTPPLVHRLSSFDSPHLQHTKELPASVSGSIALPEEEFSRDSNTSPSYDEGAIPKTPQWEPRFPSTEETKQPLSSSFEFLGISDPSKIQKSFIPPMKSNTNEQDDASQSDSEEMQLAWSPLSTHDDDGNEDSKEKQRTSGFGPSSTFSLKESISTEVHKDTEVHSSERHRDSHRDNKQRSTESEKHRDKDRDKNRKSRERRKDDSRHKESTNSSKKADETKYRDSRDRRDSSSRSRHEDKSRSGKDRDRHSSSSHHRSDDRKKDEKRDDKERTSSSKHRSSHSDDRHRHRDKDSKNTTSGSTSGRHEDKTQDEKSRTSSKGHSSDRDRRDSERKERDAKDRKSDKDKDRYKKESSRHDEKRKIKEREKAKRDKSSNVCRPHNERRSPDPDSNNGSTFGGNNQASSESMKKSNQCQDNSKETNDKGSGSADSNNKSSETSQTNNCSIDSLLSPTSNQVCPSSSLPFKKRPLLPENDCDAMLEPSSGQLLLKIKRPKCNVNVTLDSRRRKVRALRKLERLSIRSLEKSSNFVLQALNADASTPPHMSESPIHYFESDWPTKSDDNAFLAYVDGLEHSKTLSGLSDFSQSDSEEEEIVTLDGFKSESVLEGRNCMLSLTILNEDEAKKLVGSKAKVVDSKRKEKKISESKSLSSSSKGKARPRPRKLADNDVEVKRRKVNIKEVVEETPVEPKSRRARKPNKRYSNDEFTSHFDYEEDMEQSEDESPHMVERLQIDEDIKLISESHSTRSPLEDFSSTVNIKHISSVDDPDKGKDNIKSSSIQSSSSSASLPSKIVPKPTEPNSYSWNRDPYNSNSEDEADNTNNENDLIGTALKNLMMESGLGGPVEASSSQKSSSNARPKLPQLLRQNQKSIHLSGVKRVGLSRKYKGGKNFSAKPSIAAIACSEFSFPPSPDSDVSSSSFERGCPDVK